MATYIWEHLQDTGMVVLDRNEVLQASAILKGLVLNGSGPIAPSQFVGFVRTTARVVYRSPFYANPAPAGVLAYIDLLITVEYTPDASVVFGSVSVTELEWSLKAVQ